MRRLLIVFFGLIVILLVAGAVFFGLQIPEMPIKEVHKVITVPKIQQQVKLPSVPEVPSAPPVIIPYHNANMVTKTQNTPTPAPVATPVLPDPGKLPGNAASGGSHP